MASTKHLIAIAAVAVVAAAPAAADEQLALGAEHYRLCQQCHGVDGGGNRVFLAPAIAGLDSWYVETQLKKFRSGARGTHPDDVGGLRMHPMALSFNDANWERNIAAVSAYVASMTPASPAPQLKGGDAERGKLLFTPCTACHGADGKGNQALGGPPLRLASDWYLLESLKKFKAGIRGGNPAENQSAGMMRPMAATLPDEQAMLDVVAYIKTLAP